MGIKDLDKIWVKWNYIWWLNFSATGFTDGDLVKGNEIAGKGISETLVTHKNSNTLEVISKRGNNGLDYVNIFN